MGKRSRSSVDVIATAPVGSREDMGESMSIDVRKIDNGWVSCHSRSDRTGYHRREEYHAERPRLSEIEGQGTNAGSESLRDAVKSLK